MQRIGLLGGTFDPIHFGHLRVGVEVQEALGLNELWFVVAASPPHKACLTPFHHRQAMVESAIRGYKGFRCIGVEAEREGPSYSIDTLRCLTHVKQPFMHQACEFFFVLGLEQFQGITTWKEYEQLTDYAHLVVIDRGAQQGMAEKLVFQVVERAFSGYRPWNESLLRFVCDQKKDILLLHVTRLDISSSMIRSKQKTGLSVAFLTEASVIEYINANHLYDGSL